MSEMVEEVPGEVAMRRVRLGQRTGGRAACYAAKTVLRRKCCNLPLFETCSRQNGCNLLFVVAVVTSEKLIGGGSYLDKP